MGEIILDWEGHDRALSTKLWEFFKEEYLVDFSVTCHGQQMKVHKFVIALFFPMLKESLRSISTGLSALHQEEEEETERNETIETTSMLPTPECLNLDNVANHAEDMIYLIQFAYTGKTNVPKEHRDCLVRISNNMEIQCLKDSLERVNNKKKCNDQSKRTLERQNPQSQLNGVNIIMESVDLVSSNNDDCNNNEDNDLFLNDSLNRENTKKSERMHDQAQLPNTTFGRLRPRSLLKRVMMKESLYDDDDDVDFHSVFNEDLSLDIVEYSESNDEGTSGSRRVPQKRRKEDDHSKEKKPIKLVIKQSLQKLTTTGSPKEHNVGEPSNEQTTVPSNDNVKKLLKCPQCDYTAKYPNRIRKHLGSHVRKQAKNQNATEILTKTDSKVEANERTPSNEPTATSTNKVKEKKTCKCPHCEYVSKFPRDLRRHLESHARKLANGPKLANTCKTCSKSFENRHLLEVHRESKCGTEPLVCKYCGHKTSRKMILRHHMIAVHQVDANGNPLEKNVKCSECDFVCYARHQLRAHQRAKHERMGKFKCKECNYTAPYISEIRIHERTKHENIKDYMCEECGNQYKSRSRLNRHVLAWHKGLKRHKCNICNAEYSDSLSFKIHMQRHEGKVEYKFVCHICGHSLRRRFELRRHMLSKHGIELKEELTTTNNVNESQDTGKPTS